jgi:hypothetical protein
MTTFIGIGTPSRIPPNFGAPRPNLRAGNTAKDVEYTAARSTSSWFCGTNDEGRPHFLSRCPNVQPTFTRPQRTTKILVLDRSSGHDICSRVGHRLTCREPSPRSHLRDVPAALAGGALRADLRGVDGGGHANDRVSGVGVPLRADLFSDVSAHELLNRDWPNFRVSGVVQALELALATDADPSVLEA